MVTHTEEGTQKVGFGDAGDAIIVRGHYGEAGSARLGQGLSAALDKFGFLRPDDNKENEGFHEERP